MARRNWGTADWWRVVRRRCEGMASFQGQGVLVPPKPDAGRPLWEGDGAPGSPERRVYTFAKPLIFKDPKQNCALLARLASTSRENETI